MSAPAGLPTLPDTPLPEAIEVAETGATVAVADEPQTFRRWYWAAIPALAVAAYITVLRIGFLSDDYILLYRSKLDGFTFSSLLPSPDFAFYRPFSNLLTWQLGWYLFGSNPLPYHIISLTLHAITALVLGLWLAEATQRPVMGWLAGALFAVLPLHTEAVGWLAAQWDVWAAMFGLLALWLFTKWWRRADDRRRTIDDGRLPSNESSIVHRPSSTVLYLLSVLCYGLGVFSKESVLTFLPVFALAAWFVTPRFGRKELVKLVLALLPFGALVAANVVIRLLYMGSLGGYSDAHYSYSDVLWSGHAKALRMMISPINADELGGGTENIVAYLVSAALAVGLLLYWRATYRILLIAAAWLILALLPVLNVLGFFSNLEQNRLLYLPAGGYCAGVAALLHTAFVKARGRWRAALKLSVAVVITFGVGVSWLQLRPWHTATVIAASVDTELAHLIPLQPHLKGMIWYTQDRPDNYQGAYIYRLGLGVSRTFSGGVVPWTEKSLDVTTADLAVDERDSYAMRFTYDPSGPAYHVAYLMGEIPGAEPSAPGQLGDGLIVWDFRTCVTESVKAWTPNEADAVCRPGEGLRVTSTSGDPQLIGPEMALDPRASGARWVRVSVVASYPAVAKPEPYLAQLFWRGPSDSWGERASSRLSIRQDGKTHIYTAILSVDLVGPTLGGLRFDPINGTVPSDISWITIDLLH